MSEDCYIRRDALGWIVGAAALLSGCSETASSSGSFRRTHIEDQQLVAEFDESLAIETISVVDPDGEAFAETSVPTGVTQVTFDIELPYTPGEYRIIATNDEETVAETTQTIQPDLEVVDIGVGANRMEKMPEKRGRGRAAQALLTVKNTGTGPESVSKLVLTGDLPNPNDPEEYRIGIYDPEIPGEVREPVKMGIDEQRTLFTSTFPFLFQGEGVDCSTSPLKGEVSVTLHGVVSNGYSKKYSINYTASQSYDGCEISLSEVR